MSSDTTLQTTEAGVDTDIRQRDIVVGVDGSDESFAALRWALQEASLTGQRVNAVYGWTHSWDMGSEPDSEEQWAAMRHGIAKRLRDWVAQASSGMAINEDRVKLTSVRASGTAALLEIGKDAQQIVVGRRSLGRVARWFLGSLSASLAEEAKVPVTVVRARCHRQCADPRRSGGAFRHARFAAAEEPTSDRGRGGRLGNVEARVAVRH